MKKQTALRLMLFARAVYFLITLSMFLIGDWANAITNSILFVATLFVPYLGKENNNNNKNKNNNSEFYLIDVAIMSIFSITELLEKIGFFNYNNPYYGPDKILHFSAGFILAWFASIYLRPHIKNKFVQIITIISFTIAIGALWEIYEWAFSVLPPPFYIASAGYADTMMDILADTLGSLIIAGYIWRKR